MHGGSQGLVEVLLVEDDPGDAVMIIESFDSVRERARFHTVASGETALRFLRRSDEYQDAARPEAIVLDLDLPDEHGLMFLAEVKADPELRTIPVIVMSGSQRPSDVRRLEGLRADAFITKPADFDGYRAVIERISEFIFERAEKPPS
jgi:CheY-like chemotaxis protein